MLQNDTAELGLALARGNAALWVGPEWKQRAAANLDILTSVKWLGVWSESQESTFAVALDRRMREQGDRRLLIEVPDGIDTALTEYYKFAEVCPYFYLIGKSGIPDPLSRRRRDRSRGDKVAELNRLGPAVLLVAGHPIATPLAKLLREEISEDAPELRSVFVAGIEDKELEWLRKELSPAWRGRVHGTALEIDALLRAIEDRRRVPAAGPALRVGSSVVPIENLLQTEPPIDQHYLLLTMDVVRDPEPNEDRAGLMTDLLAGREPWRAFAHDLAWERPTTHLEKVRQALKRLTSSERRVQVLDVPAEPGAGLTLLLQQIAFESAKSGHPTLIHRPRQEQFDYNAIRRFLTDLYQSAEIAREDFAVPTVLVFDAPSVEADVSQKLYDLPDRLSRDDRRVLIIRALPLRGSTHLVLAPEPRPGTGRGSTDQLEPLRAVLTRAEQQSLVNWARGHGSFAAPAVDAIRGWDHATDSLPLMIALYFILTDDLRSRAGFGKHLLGYLKRLLPQQEAEQDSVADDSVLSGEQLRAAIRRLQESLCRGRVESPPTRAELTEVFFALSVLGCLRLVASRSLLADMAGIAQHRIHAVVALLEGANLVTTDLTLEAADQNHVGSPRAPVAYYTAKEVVGMRHPAYGRLALEWLARTEGQEDRAIVAGDGLGCKLLDLVVEKGHVDAYPLSLLQPLLARLNKPRDPSHVRFGAYLALRYLRLPKKVEKRRSDLADWQWHHTELLLQVLSWVNPQVAAASALTLHSRGITRYKTAHFREQYEEAERDFLAATDLARQTQEEHPGNIITSLGLLYLGWARWEREHGELARFHEIDRKTEQTLREALRERPDNSFAAFGLARYLVNCYEDPERGLEVNQRARLLAEAIELLQLEAEANFQDEWDELYAHAVGLLRDADADKVINSLIELGDELGYALEALRCLGGYIPTVPTEDPTELREIRQASEILRKAKQGSLAKRSPLADLLRYAVFSADGAERNKHPSFQARFELLQRLEGTIYLERPLWLYDYAALAFQVAQYQEAASAFARLRRGQRYFEVSKDRGQFWTESPDSLKPRSVFLRVVSAGPADERGWGRIEKPIGFRELVPFSLRTFNSRGKATRVGSGNSCYIRLNPAGPYAEPEVR